MKRPLVAEAACRCGYVRGGSSPHPCHGKAYACGKPASPRVYAVRVVGLAGTKPKLGAEMTYACDECWDEYVRVTSEAP